MLRGKFPEDIEQQIIIPPVDPMPATFEATLTESDWGMIKPELRPAMFAISKLEQKANFIYQQLVQVAEAARLREAKMIRQVNVMKWLIGVLTTAVIGAIVSKLFHL